MPQFGAQKDSTDKTAPKDSSQQATDKLNQQPSSEDDIDSKDKPL